MSSSSKTDSPPTAAPAAASVTPAVVAVSSASAVLQFLAVWGPSLAYVILYVLLDILISSEGYTNPETKRREYHYKPAAIILLTEAGKFVISCTLFIAEMFDNAARARERASSSAAAAAVETMTFKFHWKVAAGYLVPAVLYTMWNVVNYVSLLHVSLSLYSIVYQSNVFFVALLWSLTFGVKLRPMQWVALAVLACGVFVVHLRPDFSIHMDIGIVWVLLQAFISAVASVYNEWLYKHRDQVNMTINEQNSYLYFETTIMSGIYVVIIHGFAFYSPAQFFVGWSATIYFILLISILLGLSVSLILKHRDVIVKLYAGAVHSPIEVVVAHFVLGTDLTAMVLVAAVLITISTVVYYHPANRAPPAPKKEEPAMPDQTKHVDAAAPADAAAAAQPAATVVVDVPEQVDDAVKKQS